ncbi:MAG: D-2-hydroxyacid dehydrogenase [Clostridiales bacterium]|nr:D-2-hydroxyacid dehydrogenase [Clostridiales bacterium]
MQILVSLPMNEDQKQRILSSAQGANVTFAPQAEVTDEMLQNAQIVFGNLPGEMLKKAPNLKWLQLNSAGADAYTKPGALDSRVLLTNAVGAYGLTVSEHMLSLLFAMNRRLMEYDQNQQKNLWQPMGQVKSVEGSVILTLGLGNIGGDFARKVKALGAYTIGVRRNTGDCPDYVDEMHPLSSLDDLLARADVVAIALPLTEETKGMMNEARLMNMKKDALLINVGRGPIVDTDALLQVVGAGHLGGAALDVTDPEPLPPDHPLWQQERVIITPHVAGSFYLPETKNRVITVFLENLKRYRAGEQLKNLVNH